MESLLLPIALAGAFYFILLRPMLNQQKKRKETVKMRRVHARWSCPNTHAGWSCPNTPVRTDAVRKTFRTKRKKKTSRRESQPNKKREKI